MTALRNPLLWIVPAVILPLLVAVGAIATNGQARVEASLWTQVSPLIDTSAGTLKPPAQVEAETFNERLSTESFRSEVISAAGLEERAKSGDWPGESGLGSLLAKFPLTKPLAGFLGASSSSDERVNRDRALAVVKASLAAEARGNNLLYVVYTGDKADTGVALITAAIEAYQKESIGQSSAQGQAVLSFYEEQVAERQQALEEADAALRTFEAEHPVVLGAPRQTSEAQQLAQLQSIYNIRLSQYELAMNRQGDAQIRAQASLTTSDNNFQVVDAARAAPGLSLNLQRVMMLTFVGTVFGFAVGALLIVLRTWSDETVRGREDVKGIFGLDVLAALPNVKKGG